MVTASKALRAPTGSSIGVDKAIASARILRELLRRLADGHYTFTDDQDNLLGSDIVVMAEEAQLIEPLGDVGHEIVLSADFAVVSNPMRRVIHRDDEGGQIVSRPELLIRQMCSLPNAMLLNSRQVSALYEHVVKSAGQDLMDHIYDAAA